MVKDSSNFQMLAMNAPDSAKGFMGLTVKGFQAGEIVDLLGEAKTLFLRTHTANAERCNKDCQVEHCDADMHEECGYRDVPESNFVIMTDTPLQV